MAASAIDKHASSVAIRVNIALAIVAFGFFVLVLRLWYLQILKGDYFRFRSENNRLRTVFVPPPRGLIYDRDRTVLVKNRPAFNIDLTREDSPDPQRTLRDLAQILDLDADQLLKRVSDYQGQRRRFEPKLVLKDVTRDVVARVVARRFELPGISVNVVPNRDYVAGAFAPHLIGYLREINREQLESAAYSGYRPGEQIGQAGIEARWERYLQGKRGVRALIVNAIGTRIGESSFEPEIAGHDVVLTIDNDVQRAADAALAGKAGAIVAMVPTTGEILALSSAPGFDPNIFTAELTPEVWQDLQGPAAKLTNRAVQGAYPPGSTFKIFMAAAGLAEGVIGRDDRVFCPGYLAFAGRNYRCHKQTGHGAVNLAEAMAQSCDVYFYTLGQRLGIDRIHDYAKRFGLGLPPRLDLGGENSGLIPSTEWKRTHFGRSAEQKWYPGETLSVVIGQGATLVSPLQLTRSVAALVNGGRVLRPYVVKEISAADSSFKDDKFGAQEDSRLELDSKIVRVIIDSLRGVVEDPRGTGHKAALPKEFGVSVGGKTGTAQVVSLGSSDSAHTRDHAWFVGFAPVEKPRIVVTALVENGGHGGAVAAPLVRHVMATYFAKQAGLPLPSYGTSSDGADHAGATAGGDSAD